MILSNCRLIFSCISLPVSHFNGFCRVLCWSPRDVESRDNKLFYHQILFTSFSFVVIFIAFFCRMALSHIDLYCSTRIHCVSSCRCRASCSFGGAFISLRQARGFDQRPLREGGFSSSLVRSLAAPVRPWWLLGLVSYRLEHYFNRHWLCSLHYRPAFGIARLRSSALRPGSFARDRRSVLGIRHTGSATGAGDRATHRLRQSAYCVSLQAHVHGHLLPSLTYDT